MARRTFLERLADAALERASKALKAATDALDVITEPLPSETPARKTQGPRPSPPPQPRRGTRSRQGLEERLAELIGLVESQQATLERQQSEIAELRRAEAQRQRESDRDLRRQTAAERAEARAERRLNTFPRGTDLGRMGRNRWTPENLRITSISYEVIEAKYYELLRAGVPNESLRVVEIDRGRFGLYVGTS